MVVNFIIIPASKQSFLKANRTMLCVVNTETEKKNITPFTTGALCKNRVQLSDCRSRYGFSANLLIRASVTFQD